MYRIVSHDQRETAVVAHTWLIKLRWMTYVELRHEQERREIRKHFCRKKVDKWPHGKEKHW